MFRFFSRAFKVLAVVGVLFSSTAIHRAATFYIPQVADGGGLKTFLVITNLNLGRAAVVDISARTDDGADFAVLNIPNGPQGVANANVTVVAGGQMTIPTTGQGSLRVGWARITSPDDIGVSAIFQILNGSTVISSVGVLPQALSANFTVIGIIQATTQTGFAILNPGPSPVNIDVTLRDGSGIQTSSTRRVTIPATGKIARFLNQDPLFSNVSNFDGTAELVGDGDFAVLTLRLDGGSQLSGLPTLAGRTGAPLVRPEPVFEWVDATTGAGSSRVSFNGDFVTRITNEQPTSVDFAFPFTFFDTTVGQTFNSTITVSENGWISLTQGSSDNTPGASLPSATDPRALLAPFFADFRFNVDTPTVGVFRRVTGTAPNRQFVIEWKDVSFVDTTQGVATFEAIFYEGSNDIKFQYMAVGNALNNLISGGKLLIGIQNDARTIGTSINLNTSPPRNGKVYLFRNEGGNNYTLLQN